MKRILKSIKGRMRKLFPLERQYLNDYREHRKWNYSNEDLKTKDALEAQILRTTHSLEKGMSVSQPKEKFGVQVALNLLGFIKQFTDCGYSIEDSTPVKNALGVIGAYVAFHEQRGFVPENVVAALNEFKDYIPDCLQEYGPQKCSFEELENEIHGEFPTFIKSRHSLRQFADRPVDAADVRRAVEMAIRCPSACNRQPWKAYFYNEQAVNEAVGGGIGGNKAFSQDIKNYIIVTCNLSSYRRQDERNQVYVDGGIFSMALIEALHYCGIASCILQNGEDKYRNLKFKSMCGNIPENEKIILFIAIGYYKDEVIYAASHRRNADEVLVVK